MELFDKIFNALKEFIDSYIAMIKKLVDSFKNLKNDDTTEAV